VNCPFAERVTSVLSRHPGIGAVVLVGSRARGEAAELSDWDLKVETSAFRPVAAALPALVAPLKPLAQQWDRLSEHACYMLLLPGVGKVDLIFDEPCKPKPPWVVRLTTLPSIDDHFWDWTLWLAAKDRAGKQALVRSELKKMHEHLLAPLGVQRVSAGVSNAVTAYTPARAGAERRLGVAVPRAVENEVRRLLAACGFRLGGG